MSDFFGEFSWPVFVNVFPVYATAAISACLVIVAYYQIRSLRDDAAKRAAFDFFFSVFRSDRHINCRRKYLELRNSHSKTEFLLAITDSEEDRAIISEYLDFQEMFSIGVLNGGISEKYAKEAYELIIQDDWKYFQNLILKVRENTNSPSTYEHFETLGKKWSSE